MEWNGLFLDKGSAVPLYEQLRQGLLDAISKGQIPVGGKLPTEEELCAALGISRPVARQAYMLPRRRLQLTMAGGRKKF